MLPILNKDLFLVTNLDALELTLLGFLSIAPCVFAAVRWQPSLSSVWENCALVLHDGVKLCVIIACCFNIKFLANNLILVWFWIFPKVILILATEFFILRKAFSQDLVHGFFGLTLGWIVASIATVFSEFYFMWAIFLLKNDSWDPVNWKFRKFLFDFLWAPMMPKKNETATTKMMIKETIDWKTSFAKVLEFRQDFGKRLDIVRNFGEVEEKRNAQIKNTKNQTQ
jgi:hypothetical protein